MCEADMKTCTGCRQVKALPEFSRDVSKKDKLQSRCKTCCIEARRWHNSKEGKAALAAKIAKARDMEERGRKICTACGEEKPIEEFGKDREKIDGLKSCCRTCHADYQRYYCGENPEKVKECNRLYHERHPEQARLYYEENRLRIAFRASRAYAEKHGSFPIDPSQEEEIAAAFTGFCHHCGMTEERCRKKCKKNLGIDHDHGREHNNFRGWLCVPCNVNDVLATKKKEAPANV